MKITWQSLEDSVRSIASIKWLASATPQHLAGVNFDAVVEPSSEELVLIEVTKRDDLSKIREDIVKINALRLQKLSEGVLVRGYILIEDQPTTSMVETGVINKVKVMSVGDFFNEFFQYDAYIRLRKIQPFGSALNPITGKPDTVGYIPVRYQVDDDSETYDVTKISERIVNGDRIILIGDYGTGKSRCVQRVFDVLTTTARKPGKQVFAINLREHWGASSASEIVAGHLEELGLSGAIDNAMQIVSTGGAVLLLDGVDEVGAQVFGASRDNRKSVRRTALAGVRKLIEIAKGGVLLTSRSHYFDSDDEMIEALGLSVGKAPVVIRCPEEFNDTETEQYLSQINLDVRAPAWLPRKPLVFQVLSTMEKGIAAKLLDADGGELSFWNRFVTAISEREARIHGSLQAEAVRQILVNLAEITRDSESFLGRLTVRNVREAYERATQDTPDQAGEQMLMRLCTLGRVAPSSPERQFVDNYIVDGLRAEALIRSIDTQDKSITNQRWKQPLSRLGWSLLHDSLVSLDRDGAYKATLALLTRGNNYQAYAEVLSTLLAIDGPLIDACGASLSDCDVYWLRVGQRRIINITIKSSYIRNLELLPEATDARSVLELTDCQILELFGVSSSDGLPIWIHGSEIEKYDSLSNANLIKRSELGAAHTLFLAVVHKIFFQPGAGRQENALLKGGFGQKFDHKLLSKILAILLREKLIEKHPGDAGPIYGPIRKHTKRMTAIKGQLALSGDPLWTEIDGLR